MKPLFHSGRRLMTSAVASTIDPGYLAILMTRHLEGDWGELDDFDYGQNELALRTKGDRIMSVYECPQGAVWIITDCVNTAEAITTVLLPSDY